VLGNDHAGQAGQGEPVHHRGGEVADAYVTLCVHAGIAASDVICCSSLGRHAQGDSHEEAAVLLASADKDAAQAEDEGGLRPHPGDPGGGQEGQPGR
jgi:hypothetical protein